MHMHMGLMLLARSADIDSQTQPTRLRHPPVLFVFEKKYGRYRNAIPIPLNLLHHIFGCHGVKRFRTLAYLLLRQPD